MGGNHGSVDPMGWRKNTWDFCFKFWMIYVYICIYVILTKPTGRSLLCSFCLMIVWLIWPSALDVRRHYEWVCGFVGRHSSNQPLIEYADGWWLFTITPQRNWYRNMLMLTHSGKFYHQNHWFKEGGLVPGKSVHQNNLNSGFESFGSRVKVSRFYPLATQKTRVVLPQKMQIKTS